jgi:diguanylate cyclase (GGDEF)-like protein
MTDITARRFRALAAISVLLLTGDAFAAGVLIHAGALRAWIAVGTLSSVSVTLALLAGAGAVRAARRGRELHRLGRELDELLRTSGSAQESRRLLIEHAERVVPGAGAALLTTGESDQLQPTLDSIVDQTPLSRIRTDRAQARACLAIRLGRGHVRTAGDRPLAPCAVCGAVDAEIACEPLLAAGEAIGTLLVAHEKRIGAAERAALRDSTLRSAPILANQRELALTEERAINDPLTGLPNRRAAEETLRRMAAHAGRSLSPLGLVLLDLDRFRTLNDAYGHDRGDKVLTAVGKLLAETIRASDFAARFGGEEFLILLPDTDRQGSVELAEKIRRQIERSDLAQVGALTASLGVACLPEDAVEPEELTRKAGRAVYTAKAHGRNRVESAGQPSGHGA